MNRNLTHDGRLSPEDVREIWEMHPTWVLLRGYNVRWILPLFSEHLEFAEGPVSADWFHQKVADAISEQSLEADGDAGAKDGDSGQTPSGYCRQWIDSKWLKRTRSAGADGRGEYRLTEYSLRAIQIVRDFIDQNSAVTEARLGSIAHAVSQLAGMADPSAEAQLVRIDDQIADLQKRKANIERHGAEPISSEMLDRQFDEVLRLTSTLPSDFRQLSAMVEQRHREVVKRAALEHVGKGAFVEHYLRENDLLEQTPEGRAYRGFAHMLSSREIDAMRADIETILGQPFALEALTEQQRGQLESLISSLLAEENGVQETYSRWTASLRRFLSRTSAEKYQRLLTLTDQALYAGNLWTTAHPGPASLTEDVLGVGPADIADVSQIQMWRARTRAEININVSLADDTLPDDDRAALRLAAGTSPDAVQVTIDRLLDEREEVTGIDVYEATDPEFRRLGLILSLLDRAVERGEVADGADTVELTGDPSTKVVTLPHLSFAREPAGNTHD